MSISIVITSWNGEEAVNVSGIVKIYAYDLLLRINSEYKCGSAGRKINSLDVSASAQKSMCDEVDVVVSAHNVSSVVDSARFGVALAGDIKLLRAILAVQKTTKCPGIKECTDNITPVVNA